MGDPSSSPDASQQMTHWMVLCDRLLSSSTSDDVTATLQSIYDTLNVAAKEKTLLSEMIEMMILSEPKEEHSLVLTTLYRIFTASYPLQIEDGTVDAGRIYVFLLKRHTSNHRLVSVLLQSGDLISGCIDLATASTTPEYGRVLALQILQLAGQAQPATVQHQLLATPNGIARLGDLFHLSNSSSEQVQTALLQCTVAVLSQWASVAKIWIFHDILDSILQIAVQQEGGLSSSDTGGNPATVLDCITAVQQLLSHDTSMAELVFSAQQSIVITSLCQLLDLRNASRFRNPAAVAPAKPTPALSNDAVDDLDDLIASASTKSRTELSAQDAKTPEPVDDRIVPLLTDMEEQIIHKVFDVLGTVLENDQVRSMVWKNHAALCNLIWEMALLTKPPISNPYPCGIPNVQLQQRALHLVATYFHSIVILEEQLYAGMDRLFYLVCTGMGGAVSSATGADAFRISQSALYVVRQTLPDAMKNDMLMHALAPPPVEDATATAPMATVVPKLLRTIGDQLSSNAANPVLLSGSLGAVAIFIATSEIQRSILFRLTASAEDTANSSLLNAILECVMKELDATTTARREIVVPLLRFICTWIMDTPEMVQVLLNAPSTLGLSQRLLSTSSVPPSEGDDLIKALISVLFGFCLMALPKDDGSGGWTRSNVVSLLQHPSIVSVLERVKSVRDGMPWSYCSEEWKVWQDWYANAVRMVRQRMVQEMIQRPEGGAESVVGDQGTATWQGFVTDEAEQLRTELMESKRIIAAQDKQLATWKQRVESTPTELDDMLNDLTKQNGDLDCAIQKLQAEMQTMEAKHSSELEQRDLAMEALRKELTDSRAQEDESRCELDALREDMTALSEAYASLEVEYRRLTNPEVELTPATDPSELPTTDEASLETLRVENARMRQEAQDADEWMSMAVDRMQTMTNEIASLQEQVFSLNSQLESGGATDLTPSALHVDDPQAIPQGLDEVHGSPSTEIVLLQKSVEDLQAQISQFHADMESVIQREQMEVSARDARIQELEGLLQDTEQVHRLQQEIVQLNEANDEAQAWMSKAVEHHHLLMEQVASLSGQKSDLQARVDELELVSNRNSAAEIQTDMDNFRAEAASRENEISKFKDLVSQQQAQLDTFAQMEIELSDVRSHILTLQDQVISKDQEIELLQKRLAAPNLVNHLEEQSSLVDFLKAELADRSEQVYILTSEIEELRENHKELLQKVDDLETVRIEAGTKEEEILGLRARMAEAEARKEAIQNILDAVAKEKEELALEFDKNQHALEKIETELNKVRRGDLDTTQSNEIESNLEDLQNTIKTLEAQLVSQCDEATSVVQQWEETYAELQSSHDELENTLQKANNSRAQLEHDLIEAKQAVEKLQEDLQNVQSTRISQLETLTENLKDQLLDQEKDSNDAINQLQDSYIDMESKLNVATSEKESLLFQLKNAEDKFQQEMSTKHDELIQRITDLEDQLTSHEKDASIVVLQWQESYGHVESKLNEVVLENEILMSQLKVFQEKETLPEVEPIESSKGLLESNDDQLSELIQQVKNLKEQLEDQAQDAMDIVQQWQDSYNDLESRLSAMKEEKDELEKQLHEVKNSEMGSTNPSESQNDEASQRQYRIDELEQTVKQLEEQLVSYEEESNAVVSQWQQCYNDAIANNDTILADFQNTREAFDLLQKEHDAVMKETSNAAEKDANVVSELKSTIDSLQRQLSERSETADRVANLQAECDKCLSELNVAVSKKQELEVEVSNLVLQLEDQRIESHDIAMKLQHSLDDINARFESSESDKKTLMDELMLAKTSFSSLQMKYDEAASSADHAHNLEQQLAESSVTVHNLQQQLEALNDIVNQWQESHGHVTEELKETMLELQERRDASASQQKQLDDANSFAQNSLMELQEAKNSVEDYGATIRLLEEQLKTQDLEFSTSLQRFSEVENSLTQRLSKSDETVSLLESQLRIREDDLRALQESFSVLQGSLLEKDTELARISSELSVLMEEHKNTEAALRSLGTQLVEQEEDARSTVEQWQLSYQALQAHCEDAISDLEESRGTIATLQSQLNVKSQLSSAVCDDPASQEKALLVKIEELQDQLVKDSENAQHVVSQWETEYNNVVSDLSFALKENEELVARLRQAEEHVSGQDLQISEPHLSRECLELRSKVDELSASLNDSNNAKDELLHQIATMSKNAACLKDEGESLKLQLVDVNHQNATLLSTTKAFEVEVKQRIDTIDSLRKELKSRIEENSVLSKQISNFTDSSDLLDKVKSDMELMKNEYESQLRIAHLGNEQSEVLMQDLRRENASFVHERDSLLMRLAELEDKLSDAHDTLQLHKTDEASRSAAEIAAAALREQVQSMYDQAQVDHRTIGDLSHARNIAEAEVEKLRNDLASLVGVDDYENNRAFIEGRAKEASEILQRAERNEIASLRTSLSRALDELTLVRSSEKELEERAAKATHQASLFEQELMTTKSDFQFLTKTMDDMRDSESSRRMSLEYRISSLENEQKVLRHYHSTELDNIRNELNHMTMERDRLYQSLKDSEKNREMMLQASSRDVIANGGDGDPYVELNRLRMEKAQLLSAAAEEASQMEHRLREAQLASKAIADAEIFVERELRVQAEKSLERNVIEMAELRMVGMDHRHGSYNMEVLEQRLESAQNEILRLKAESQSLIADSNLLREHLQDTKKEHSLTIARLTEECRQANARASQLEREGRYEAEVRVEVARLQAASAQNSRNASLNNTPERNMVLRNMSTNNPAVDPNDRMDDGSSLTASKLYDALQKQTKATEEQRTFYFELLAEHDDLLAVLAKQDLLQGSLQKSLEQHCGKEAVDAAVQEAEEQARMKYGKYVKLTVH